MYGSQEKILGQKVNVKFFTVDPYVGGAGLPRPFSKFANYWKNIFLKIKTSKIKSEKNIYQTIHNTRFIFIFFGIFTIFLYFSRFFEEKKYQNSEKITAFFSRFHSQILQNNLVFWQFSRVPRHVEGSGKLPNLYQSGLGGLWKRLIDFLPTCHKGLHDHLRSVMSMHFWRFFHFFEIFCMFWVNWTIERSPVLKK